jgi:O-antigen/teichoic acid export membrane protein
MLPFAIPYGIICVLGVLSPVIQRTLTESQLGSESLGLYAAAVQISMVISLFAGSFQTAWGPFYLSIYKKSDAGHTYNLILKLFALAICVITLLLTILSQPLILVLASDKYIEALVIIFPLAMGLAIQSVSWITEIGIEISKKSYLNLYSQLFAVFVTICGILILGPWFNLFGIAMGVLLGIIAKVFTASWLAQRVYPLPWQYPPVILLIIVTFGFGMFSLLIAESFGKTYQISFLIFSIFVLLVIGLCKLFSRPERQFLLSLFRVRYGATK